MKTTENYLAEIKEIRKMMEGSSRFLSLSGLSGILIGIYALIGAFAAYQMLHMRPPYPTLFNGEIVAQLFVLAAIILLLSLITILLLTYRRALKAGKKIRNPGSRLMLLNLSIPLISGGLLLLIFVFRNHFEIVVPGSLIFYGLALVNSAKFTRQEIFYLGIFEVSLGVLAALAPSLQLLFWALGFGVLHIIYGAVMYFRYERAANS